MADSQLHRMLSSLEAQFDAAVSREEDEAASDLALSLRQGISLAEAMRRGAWVAHCRGARRPVSHVGADFIACLLEHGTKMTLIPAAHIVASPVDGSAPAVSPVKLVEALRAACRARATVEIVGATSSFGGRLSHVGPDHAAVESNGTRTFVSLALAVEVHVTGGPEICGL